MKTITKIAIACAVVAACASLITLGMQAMRPKARISVAKVDPVAATIAKLSPPALPALPPPIDVDTIKDLPAAPVGVWLPETHGNSLPVPVPLVAVPEPQAAPLPVAAAPREKRPRHAPRKPVQVAEESAAHQSPEDARAVREAEIAAEIARRRVTREERRRIEDGARWPDVLPPR